MWLTRSLGVNLHPTSLPGGRLGPEAYTFVDWLAAAGARFWQILPLNPPDKYGSPYASASAFAAWPGLLADPDAPVARTELRRFERANGFWIGDWIGFAGAGALADQVRFQREWSSLRSYAADRDIQGCRLAVAGTELRAAGQGYYQLSFVDESQCRLHLDCLRQS